MLKMRWIILVLIFACSSAYSEESGNGKSISEPNPASQQEQQSSKKISTPIEKTTTNKKQETSKDPESDANDNAETDGQLVKYTGQLADYTNRLSSYTFLLVIATLILGIIGTWQGYLTWRAVTLAGEEFIATHRPRITIRACKVSMQEPGYAQDGSGLISRCKFIYQNDGDSPAYILEIGARVFNWPICSTSAGREIHFSKVEKRNSVLHSGESDTFFTNPEFEWSGIDSTWFFVGYVKYTDRHNGTVIRKTGFCRKWNSSSADWDYEKNDEYEYAF